MLSLVDPATVSAMLGMRRAVNGTDLFHAGESRPSKQTALSISCGRGRAQSSNSPAAAACHRLEDVATGCYTATSSWRMTV